jgi:hypothetical protein
MFNNWAAIYERVIRKAILSKNVDTTLVLFPTVVEL